MQIDLRKILHPRLLDDITHNLFLDGHFNQAARNAFILVETTIREVSGKKGKTTAVNLISSLLDDSIGIKLKLPFGVERKQEAKAFLTGAFRFYRNYFAHEEPSQQIERTHCIRILMLASEILFLLDASDKSYTEVGGLNGLIKEGLFSDTTSALKLLRKLDCPGQFPDDELEGFWEEINEQGYISDQVMALIDVGLVKYESTEFVPNQDYPYDPYIPMTIGGFIITDLGQTVLEDPNFSIA